LRKVQRFDIQHYPCQIASEVPDEMFDPANFFVNPKNIKSNDRYTHFAVAAARQALQDGVYGDTHETIRNPTRIGVMVGTAFGGMETFEQETLKLHKKPERPKVRKNIKNGESMSGINNKYIFYIQKGKKSNSNSITDLVFSFMFLLGFTVYNSSIIGQYSIWCNWY
jgi:3-oxoacyl-(acyl-carrier-protein) synthase